MTLKPLDVLQPVLLRVCLALVGLSSLLRSRMEVSSPPTSFDHLSDIAFLLKSDTEPASLPYFPTLLLPFHEMTGGKILPAVFLGAIADAMSGGALYHLALSLGLSSKDAVDVAMMFLWNPLTIASCVSGSADPLRLCAVFVAAAVAAGKQQRLSVAGGYLALALHFSPSSSYFSWFSPTLWISIPLIMLSIQKQQNTKNTNANRTTSSPRTAAAAAAAFLAGFILTATTLFLASNYLLYSDFTPLDILNNKYTKESQPWSNIEPNLGLQWYLFAEVLPPFRDLYAYVFWALSTALCVAVALRFGRKNPLVVLVAQGIVLGMLGRHPTYSDIMLWLGLVPLVMLMRQQTQEKKKTKKTQRQSSQGEESNGSARDKYIKVWLAIGFCISLALNTAAYEVWLTLGTGNANFFYGMNLIWAAWQALALIQLLKSTAAAEDDL